MTTTERRGRLTYERLINSLERLHGAVGAQFPDLKDAGRAQDLQRAITDVHTTARAGISGAFVASPAQLKQEIKAHVTQIHERHDAIDEAEGHAQDDAQIRALSSSAASGNLNPSLALSEQTPALKRARGTRDSNKENAASPATPCFQPPARKLSAVRKTTITKRATSSKSPITAGIKKRPSRSTRSKLAVHDLTVTPQPSTDEADRRAAAAALLGLAEHSPETSFTSFTSSSRGITPPTAGRKRTHRVYEDDTSFQHPTQSQGYVGSSPLPKKHVLASGTYAPVPVFDEEMSVQQAFLMGIEYAVRHLASSGDSEGEELRAWAEKQLRSQTAPQFDKPLEMDRNNADDGTTTVREAAGVGHSAVDGGKKGFWDVV